MNTKSQDEVADLLRIQLIIQLGMSGVKQANIRKVVGGDINKINGILKIVLPKNARKK